MRVFHLQTKICINQTKGLHFRVYTVLYLSRIKFPVVTTKDIIKYLNFVSSLTIIVLQLFLPNLLFKDRIIHYHKSWTHELSLKWVWRILNPGEFILETNEYDCTPSIGVWLYNWQLFKLTSTLIIMFVKKYVYF